MWYSSIWGNLPLNVSNLSAKKLKAFESSLEFQNIFANFYQAALNAFKYNGLPDTMDERMIERAFLLTGRCLAGEVDGNVLSLVGAPASGWTLYGYPASAYGWGFNGFNKEFRVYVPGADDSKDIRKNAGGIPNLEKPNAVMGYDNSMGYPYINYLITECHRLANLKMAIDVIVENLKQPMIVSCDDTAINSVREAFKQRTDNLPAIVGTGKLPLDTFNVWDTKVSPETLQAFKDLYEWYENNLRTIFGINSNEQTDKKERLLVDEINSNNQMIADSIEKRLVWRERFVDECNKVFGTNITVEINKPETEEVEDDVDEQELHGPDGIQGLSE